MGFIYRIIKKVANRYKRNRLYRINVYSVHEQAPSAKRIYNELAKMTARFTELSLGQQEGYRMDGADFGTSELICPTDTIINGFHFPYPLNGSNNIQNRYRI